MEEQPLSAKAAVAIEFVNHASFILEFGGVRVINDPWLFGSAFNDGWRLLRDYPFDLERFSEIDYIWISHEHPDHFSPLVLNSIPENIREGVTVLFQKTIDRKVVDFCSSIGFNTRELIHNEPVTLGDRFSVVCGTVPMYDSWIMYDCDGLKVLNINDCIVDGDARAEDIQRLVGSVDLLFTQFSYAGWKGNPEDTALRRTSAASKLEAMKKQIEVFKPEWTVPFASFAYFSHEENRHSNDCVNRPQDAVRAIKGTGSKAVVMYPGDEWTVATEWDNGPALTRYEHDYDLSGKKFSDSPGVTDSELIDAANSYIDRIGSRNNRLILKLLKWIPLMGLLRPLDIFVYDLRSTYAFSLQRGLTKRQDDGQYDIKLHSSSLCYLLRFEWGLDTLVINGRFEADMKGFAKMKKTFTLGPLNNTGRGVRFRLLLDLAFLRMLGKAALRLNRLGA